MSKIWKHKSYEAYIDAQKQLTNKKYGKIVFVRDSVIESISKYFKDRNVQSILCHGTRTGDEQKLFKKYFGCYVWGSELSERAHDADMTTVWDFNKVNPDWVGKFDIIYSNSFDHCITPKETLGVWKDQLTENGRLCIEWTEFHNNDISAGDPLAATEAEITGWAEQNGMELEAEVLKHKAKYQGTVLVYKVK